MEETMKKNLSLLAAFLVVGFCATPALAADHYVSAFGGVSWINGNDIDPGFTGTAAIGCDYGDTRLEAEMGYQNGSDADYDLDLYSLMANGYYDVDLGGADLYLTAGVGIAQADASVDDEKSSLAYQFGVGVAAPVADGVMLDARYRYFTTIDNDSISSNGALLGLRIGL